MIWQTYQLDNKTLKANEPITLWKTENGIIEISKGTLAKPIMLDDQRKGYVFHGQSKLLLDTIVETEKGAVGKPVEKEMTEPFLMLGDTETIQEHLSTADKQDLEIAGYENEQQLTARAKELCDRFFRRTSVCGHGTFGWNHGFIFAFPNNANKLDVLIAKDTNLIYRATDRVFLSNKGKAILKTPGEVIIAHSGRSFVVKRSCCV
jgi:hypothetical protein